MKKCDIKGCKNKATVFGKNSNLCEQHAIQYGFLNVPIFLDYVKERGDRNGKD